MTKSMDVNVMVDVHMERGNEGNGVSLKIGNAWEKVKEVSFYILFLWDPILLSAVETYYCLWQAVGNDLMFEVEVINPKDDQRDMTKED